MNYKYPDTKILVFCKTPVAGQVKTRLMPDLSAEQAADVHMALTRHTLTMLFDAHLSPTELWSHPDIHHQFCTDCVYDYEVSLHPQQGNDLGERMNHAIGTTLQQTSKVLLLGSDCPSLTAKDIEFAINALQDNDVVIAPAEDGGYVLIGMSKPHPELFLNMVWGTNDVLDVTRQRIKQAELTTIETKQQWDVDTFDDFQRFLRNSRLR